MTGDHGLDGSTSDDPSPRGGWITRWTELLLWPLRELLIATTAGSAPPMEEVAARLDAVQGLTGRLEQAEIQFRRELDAVRATTAALGRRVAALEAQAREDASEEPDVPHLPVRSPDAFRQVLSRAKEVAAQRGLKTSGDSATVVTDRGPEMPAAPDGGSMVSAPRAGRRTGRRPRS